MIATGFSAPRALIFAAGLVGLAADAVAHGRLEAARALRKVAWSAHRAATRWGDRVEGSLLRAEDALGRLSGRIAGCGCVDNDPECCAEARGGEYCECPRCHGGAS